jgi:phenylalanyl-tRNA synthetase alpha chain
MALTVTWTEVQTKRLRELATDDSDQNRQFLDEQERDRAFQKMEHEMAAKSRERLREFRDVHRRPALCRLESKLTEVLVKDGFVQVITPTIMSKGLLKKMSIGDDHPLASQVFWLDKDKCLRPMLAPHLYFVSKDLLRLWDRPVRLFEVGSCFRKESQGSQHSSEFTMLNLAEFGLSEEKRESRIAELAAVVTQAAGISDFSLEQRESEVYGDTIDVVAGEGRLEIGSAAMGPHPLDRAWRITDTWVGIGFGLERLLMITENSQNLKRMARSLSYLDGVRLNV